MSSSSFVARWLFRALLGSAFGRAGWKEFWKWALPPKRRGVMTTLNFNRLMIDNYLEPMMEQLKGETMVYVQPGSLKPKTAFEEAVDEEARAAIHDHRLDAMRYMAMVPKRPYVPPTRRQKLERKVKRKLERMKPVLTTQGSIEDRESDY